MGGRRGKDKKPNYVAGGREAESCVRHRVLHSGLDGNTYFVYLALRTSALEMGQTLRLGRRNTLL